MKDYKNYKLAMAKHMTTLLEQSGLTIAEVSEKTGYTLVETIKYFSGQKEMSVMSILKIASAMKVPYKKFFDFDYKRFL